MDDKAKARLVDILKDELGEPESHSLGTLIAVVNKTDLINRLKTDADLSTLPDQNIIGALKELLIKIKEFENDTRQRTAVLTAIPRIECDQESCFLEEKWDFFVPYLVDVFQDNFDGEVCKRLMKHLNDCFRCMNCFSEVMRDYNRQYSIPKQG